MQTMAHAFRQLILQQRDRRRCCPADVSIFIPSRPRNRYGRRPGGTTAAVGL